MNVILITQYFYPENFKSNDIAFELKKRGHTVTVLTGLPNYPDGKLYKGYGFFKKRSEVINGVKVHRTLLTLRGKGGGGRLFLNYFSWAFFASIKAISLSFFNKFDAIIVHEPSPITQGIPAVILKKIIKAPIYFWVLDLWPESLKSAGNINNRFILKIFEKLTSYIYSKSDKILISSKGFRESIIQKGDFSEKLIYFPNWAEDSISKGDKFKEIPHLPDGFKVLFAGNIGASQDMKAILSGANKLKKYKNIKIIIVGDGRKKKWVEEYIVNKNLEETVFLMGRYPIEYMTAFFYKADALLVTLKDEFIFNLTVPAKMQAYMSVGKPVLTMLNGEGNNILNEANAGYAANAGDYNQLSLNIKKMSILSFDERKKLGENALNYYRENFTLNKCITHLEEIINN